MLRYSRVALRVSNLIPRILEPSDRWRCRGVGGRAMLLVPPDRSISVESLLKYKKRPPPPDISAENNYGIPPNIRGTYQRKIAAAYGHRLGKVPLKTDAFLSIYEDMLDRESGVWFNDAVHEFGFVLNFLPKPVKDKVKSYMIKVHAKLWGREVFGDRHSFDFDVKLWGSPKRRKRERKNADWSRFCFKRCSDFMFEAIRVGSFDDHELAHIFTCMLQTAEPEHWRKVSSMVDCELKEEFRYNPKLPHYAIAAALCWRVGAFSRAARHLDEMLGVEGMRVLGSFQPLWRAYHRRLHTTPTYQGWLWPNLLIAMDIYGRAERWAEVVDAFSALAYGVNPPIKPPGGSKKRLGRPKKKGSAKDHAVPPPIAPLAPLHPSPLAYAVTACLMFDQVEEAAAALSGIKVSLRSDAAKAGAVCGGGVPRTPSGVRMGVTPGKGVDGGDDDAESLAVQEEIRADRFGADSTEEFVYMGGHPDAAWVDSTVRAFLKADRPDLAAAVLSPEICEWACVDAVARDEIQQNAGESGEEDRVRRAMEKLQQSLGAFLEQEAGVKRLTNGSVEGAKRCAQALEMAVEAVGASRSFTSSGSPKAGTTEPATTPETENGDHADESLSLGCPLEAAAKTKAIEYVGEDEHLGYPLETEVEAEDSEHLDKNESLGCSLEAGSTTADGNGEARTRTELVNAEALRWLSSPEIRGEACGGLSAESAEDTNSPGGVTDELLRSRIASLSAEIILATMRRAWASDSFRLKEEIKDVGKLAALALYEAGINAGKLSAGAQWASTAAGVVDLSGGHFSTSQAVGMGALNIVLRDMLRQYAYEEEVNRHVHDPRTDLIVIVDSTVSRVAVSNARAILWLLRSEFSRFENGALSPPELLGLGTAIYDNPEVSQPLLSVGKQIMERPHKSGVVLCLPRLQLQGWLLAEGCAWRGDEGESWSPPWVELEAGAPPLLPVNT